MNLYGIPMTQVISDNGPFYAVQVESSLLNDPYEMQRLMFSINENGLRIAMQGAFGLMLLEKATP